MALSTGETIVLQRMAREGHTASEIARVLGRTADQVRDAAWHMHLRLARDWNRRERTGRRRVHQLTEQHHNTIQGFSPVAVRGLVELEAGLAWIARHTQHGYVVHDGRVRTIGAAVANLIYDLHLDARRARTGEVA